VIEVISRKVHSDSGKRYIMIIRTKNRVWSQR